ncbi:MAG: MMPL family transporter [Planctomycetes bacterium]|nr:MMPL family transporter [Planctomycetota bacterium]
MVAIVVVAAISPGALRLQLRTDGHALVPDNAPEIQVDRDIRREFGIDDPVVVFIETDDDNGIFNADTMALVDALTSAFKNLEGIRPASVFSLATESSDRVFPGTIRFRRFLEPLPTTRADLDRVRDDLRRIRLYNGTLVSSDKRATAVLVGIPQSANRLELLAAINETIAAHDLRGDRIHVIGAPVAEALLGTHILEDLGVPTSLLGVSTRANRTNDAIERSRVEVLRSWIAEHIGLAPLAIAIMGVVFLISFKSVSAVALPLGEVGACLVVVFAVMGWVGVPVYLTTAVLPVILTATGITDEIHIFSRYRQLLRADQKKKHTDQVLIVMQEMGRPIVMTSITTSIAFLSFAFSTIAPVRAFGLFTALGIVFCMLWSLTVIPACLAMIPPGRFVGRRAAGATGPPATAFRRVGELVTRWRYAVIAIAVVLTVAAPFGVRKIVVQDSWIDGFSPDSEFHRATTAFNERFLGAHVLLVRFDTGHSALTGQIPPQAVDHRTLRLPLTVTNDERSLVGMQLRLTRATDPSSRDRDKSTMTEWVAWIEGATRFDDHIMFSLERGHIPPAHALRLGADERMNYEIAPRRLLRPEAIKRIHLFETYVETCKSEAVGGVVGTGDYVATVNYMLSGRRERERRISNDVRRIARIWSEYERIRGTARLRQLVSADFSRSVSTILLKNANFVDTARLMTKIRDYETNYLAPHNISLAFGGDVAVSQSLIEAIVDTQVVSVLGSLAGVLIVTMLLGRSLGFGLCCVLPSALAVLLNFAAMGVLGIPLGVATSMFSAMTLGIGVDYAIHLQLRYRRLLSEGITPSDALPEAVAITGSAIGIDTLAVALGFGVMIFSQVPANARLGGLVALSIVNCFLATVILLPALLSLGHKRSRNVPRVVFIE